MPAALGSCPSGTITSPYTSSPWQGMQRENSGKSGRCIKGRQHPEAASKRAIIASINSRFIVNSPSFGLRVVTQFARKLYPTLTEVQLFLAFFPSIPPLSYLLASVVCLPAPLSAAECHSLPFVNSDKTVTEHSHYRCSPTSTQVSAPCFVLTGTVNLSHRTSFSWHHQTLDLSGV